MPVAQRNRAPKTKKAARSDRTALAGTPQRSVVLDIEGTTSPISFVTDVLFPYARDNVRRHLDATYSTRETKDDIALLRAQVSFPVVPRHESRSRCCRIALHRSTANEQIELLLSFAPPRPWSSC